jgi:hypothetical protein
VKKLALDEIIGLDRYEQIRDDFRRRIIELKKHRRVAVGGQVTFVFENRETMLFQTQEMLRAEHIADLDKIREELEVYNELIPEQNELSSTMLIEITESEKIRPTLVGLIGIDRAVRMEIGNSITIPGEFEGGRSKEDNVSAVQYVRFKLDDRARQAFVERREPVRLVIDHPQYRHSAPIQGAVRESLAQDLTAP